MADHPIFAALYDRMLARAERGGLGDMRRSLLAGASGRTLELGAGTGANLAHYPEAVDELMLTEPDPHMARRLRERLAAEPPPVRHEVVDAGAEDLPFDDGSFDTVVSTLVFCTVGDPRAAAEEVARVLRPGGSLLVLEHVRDDGRLGGWQDRLQRPWGWVAGGCHPNRDTAATLAEAGLETDAVISAALPEFPSLVRPALHGSIRRRSG